jgi:hypothetical protein
MPPCDAVPVNPQLHSLYWRWPVYTASMLQTHKRAISEIKSAQQRVKKATEERDKLKEKLKKAQARLAVEKERLRKSQEQLES